jgi:hypothetical protein
MRTSLIAARNEPRLLESFLPSLSSAAPSVAQAAFDHPEATDPSGPPPEETIVAYVRDVKRNEVTVMSGTGEVTYRDPVLVKRLVKAAPASDSTRK